MLRKRAFALLSLCCRCLSPMRAAIWRVYRPKAMRTQFPALFQTATDSYSHLRQDAVNMYSVNDLPVFAEPQRSARWMSMDKLEQRDMTHGLSFVLEQR